MMKKTTFLFLILGLCLSSCRKMIDYVFEEEDMEFIEELTLMASSNMNRRMPMRVDFVVVKNPIVGEQVARLSARQFMKQRKQLKRDYPQHIKIKSFELVPGESVVMPLPYLKKEVATAFLFADYNNQNPNRWSVYSADCVTIKLKERTAEITSHKWNAPEKIKHARANDGVVVLG